MKTKTAVAALSALAQEHRLAAYRALVQAGPEGLCPSDLAERLDVPGPTLSFHLAQLRHAGLVTVERRSRSLIYAANYSAMNALVGFLTENCCGGTSVCAPLCTPKTAKPRRSVRAS